MDSDAGFLIVKQNPHISTDLVVVDSAFKIHYFTLNGQEIYKMNTLSEHKKRIHDICFLKGKEDMLKTAFFSASSDGTIKLWDAKVNSSVKTIKRI